MQLMDPIQFCEAWSRHQLHRDRFRTSQIPLVDGTRLSILSSRDARAVRGSAREREREKGVREREKGVKEKE